MYQKLSSFFLRISMGSLFLYSGLSHLFDKGWSAAGYIGSAQNFVPFFQWFASPAILPITNQLNIWGLILIGVSLIIGFYVRYTAVLGAILMLLYYLVLPFPMPNAHAYIIDEHIIYIFALLALSAYNDGRIWGLDARRAK